MPVRRTNNKQTSRILEQQALEILKFICLNFLPLYFPQKETPDIFAALR